MSDGGLSKAFGEGIHRERELFDRRVDWTSKDWWERKEFLEDQLKLEDDVLDLARIQGRLMAVCAEGQRLFDTR